MGMVDKEELVLEGLFIPMDTYILKGDVLIGVTCVTLGLSLRKGLYVGNIQWDSMRKFSTAWDNIYGAGVLEMGDTIFTRDGKEFTMKGAEEITNGV